MSQFTIPAIIELGDVSTYLSANYVAEGNLFGERLAITSPQTIALVTDALRWQTEGNPDDPTLRGVANYLYWICGKFNLEAQYIINGVGGGTILPINPIYAPNPIEFKVTSSSFMVNGQSTAIISSYVGYNMLFIRNNITQSLIDLGDGSSYFSWDKVTGTFICYGAATTGELFQLYPLI